MEKKKLLFGKRNYKFMLIGIFFIALGFILMSGGGSEDPNILMKKYIVLGELDLLQC